MSAIAEGGQTVSSSTRRARLIAIASAVVGAIVVWAIARVALGENPHSPAFNGQSSNQVSIGFVIGASLLASLASWGLLALLERFTSRPKTLWVITAAVVFVLSLGGPLSGTGINTGDRVALLLMHVSVAATLIPLLSRTSVNAGNRA